MSQKSTNFAAEMNEGAEEVSSFCLKNQDARYWRFIIRYLLSNNRIRL
jgi:hypothetical protein